MDHLIDVLIAVVTGVAVLTLLSAWDSRSSSE